jgi:hypothetical protein
MAVEIGSLRRELVIFCKIVGLIPQADVSVDIVVTWT